MEMVVGKHGGQSMSGDDVKFPKCKVKMPMTPPSSYIVLARINLELVCLQGKTLTQDAMKRLWFDVHAAGWRHSMELHGCCSKISSISIITWIHINCIRDSRFRNICK